MFKAFVKLSVLLQLKGQSQSGYDLMKHIGEVCGKPSPGYIYPLLNSMEAKGFISSEAEGRRKVYSVTAKGMGLLSELKKKRDEMLRNMVMILGSVADSGETKEMEGMIEYLKEGNMLGRFHRALFSAYCGDEERKERIRKIVGEAAGKMEALLRDGGYAKRRAGLKQGGCAPGRRRQAPRARHIKMHL
jgi:DNA-binding PadR family transcriptional regulator